MNITKKDNAPLTINFWILSAAAIITFIALISGFIFLNTTRRSLNKKMIEAKEATRPAELSITVLQDSACTECNSLQPLIDNIKKANVKITAEKTIEAATAESQELIAKYKIAKLPSMIVSGELDKEKTLTDLWSKLGEIKDGVFVLTQVGAPYLLVSTGEVKGRVKLIMLTDKDCKTCYDVTNHESVLSRYGVPTTDQKVVEASFADGKELISKYQIKLLPTIILSGDLEAYPALKSVWSSVGTIEKDGTYVFREGVKQMGAYKDLATNQIIEPKTDKK